MLIRNSKKELILTNILDSEYYLYMYDDIRKSKIDPKTHWIKYGIKERRKPNAFLNYYKLDELLHKYVENVRILVYEKKKEYWDVNILNYVSSEMLDRYKNEKSSQSPLVYFKNNYKIDNNFLKSIDLFRQPLEKPHVTNFEREILYLAQESENRHHD